MSNVKKQFEELYAILEENKAKKISTVMPQLLELMTRKNNASGSATTFYKDEEGDTIAVYCYYHKQWELIADVDYGLKKGTATGLNTMCKQGVSTWTKQQRVKKQKEADLLNQVSSGALAVEDIGAAQTVIIEEAKEIAAREDGHGFDSVDEALDFLNNRS